MQFEVNLDPARVWDLWRECYSRTSRRMLSPLEFQHRNFVEAWKPFVKLICDGINKLAKDQPEESLRAALDAALAENYALRARLEKLQENLNHEQQPVQSGPRRRAVSKPRSKGGKRSTGRVVSDGPPVP